MAKFDRSKYKAAKLKNKPEEVKTINKNNNDRVGFVKLKEGKNIVRIFPPHDPNDYFIYQISKSWLPYKKKDDNGNETGEIGRRPVFNAKVHSPHDKDIIEEYIKFAEAEFKEQCTDVKTGDLDADAFKKKTDLLYGNFQSQTQGIVPENKFMSYVSITHGGNTEFGRTEFPKAVKMRLDQISSSGEAVDEPVNTDPFTDPESGHAVEVVYTPKAKPQEKYITELLWRNPAPISDDLGLLWESQPSLKSLLVNSYTSKDFEKALEGLELFDEQHKVGVFANDEFLTICEELAALYPDQESDDKKDDLPFDAPKEVEQTPKEQPKEEPVPDQPEQQSYPSKEMSDDDKKAKLAALRAKIGKK